MRIGEVNIAGCPVVAPLQRADIGQLLYHRQ